MQNFICGQTITLNSEHNKQLNLFNTFIAFCQRTSTGICTCIFAIFTFNFLRSCKLHVYITYNLYIQCLFTCLHTLKLLIFPHPVSTVHLYGLALGGPPGCLRKVRRGLQKLFATWILSWKLQYKYKLIWI